MIKSAQIQQPGLPLEILPHALLLYIFKLLGPYQTAYLSGTCRAIYNKCALESCWKYFYEINFGKEATNKLSSEFDKHHASSRCAVGKYFWKKWYSIDRRHPLPPYYPPDHYALTYDRKDALLACLIYNYIPVNYRSFKVAVLGQDGVGKTTLNTVFLGGIRSSNTFDVNMQDEDRPKRVFFNLDKKRIGVFFDVFHSSAEFEYEAMRDQLFREYHAFLLCFSITSRDSLGRVVNHISQIQRAKDFTSESDTNTVPMILVGNKLDLGRTRQVEPIEAMEVAKNFNILYIETCATKGVNVNLAFELLALEEGARLLAKQGAPTSKQKEEEKCITM